MYCKKCGTQISTNERVCPNCATPVGSVTTSEAAHVAVPLKEVRGKKNKGLVVVIIVLVALLLLVGAAFGIYVYVNSQNTAGNSYTYEETKGQPSEDETEENEDNEKPDEEEEKDTETGLVDKKQKQAEEFLKKAEEIEKYAETHLQTAKTQYELNTESGTVYKKWDELLNEVYQYLKETMPSDEFEALRKEELEWIKEKEAAIEETAEKWSGGSGAPMACNMTGIDYTRERCYELIDMID